MQTARPFPFRRQTSGARKEGAPIAWAILAWAVGLIVFFPAFYIVATGFKSEATAVQLPPKFIPLPSEVSISGEVVKLAPGAVPTPAGTASR